MASSSSVTAAAAAAAAIDDDDGNGDVDGKGQTDGKRIWSLNGFNGGRYSGKMLPVYRYLSQQLVGNNYQFCGRFTDSDIAAAAAAAAAPLPNVALLGSHPETVQVVAVQTHEQQTFNDYGHYSNGSKFTSCGLNEYEADEEGDGGRGWMDGRNFLTDWQLLQGAIYTHKKPSASLVR